MKIALISMVLMSFTTFAGDRNTAYDVVCKKMPFDNDRNTCVAQIRPHNYFDDKGLQICAKFPFADAQLECLSAIADKSYENYEMQTCISAVFDSEKLACLKNNGSQSGGGQGCIPTRDIIDQLRSTQNDIRLGNPGTADKRLTYLINNLQNCK